jgi:hypothetical protein
VVLALPAWRSDQASVVTAATPERQRDTKGGGHGHDTQYPSPAEQDAGGASFGENRTCRASACDTTLSRYNPDAYCFVHRDQVPQQRMIRRWST